MAQKISDELKTAEGVFNRYCEIASGALEATTPEMRALDKLASWYGLDQKAELRELTSKTTAEVRELIHTLIIPMLKPLGVVLSESSSFECPHCHMLISWSSLKTSSSGSAHSSGGSSPSQESSNGGTPTPETG